MVINRARTGTYPPISDYGIVGDGRSAALISGAGSIDWWCPERFDTPSIFAAVLDRRRGGRFRIRPVGLNWSAEQRYLPSSCVLETVFTTLAGRVRLLDFAPVPAAGPVALDAPDRGLIRLIEGLSGSVTLEVGFDPRFNYGHEVPAVTDLADGSLAEGRHGWARLHTTAPMGFEAGRGRISVAPGDRVALTCTACTDGTHAPRADGQFDASNPWLALEETVGYWSHWASRSTYVGPYHAQVERSLLTLKLLTFAPTGAPVACVTSSLPRWIPSERTWDMRFAWLREVAQAASAFSRTGYQAEAEAAIHWLVGITRESLSDIDGSRAGANVNASILGARAVDGLPVPAEWELDWLEGYEGCRPVRVGNNAASSLQLDVAGEIAMAAEVVGGSEAKTLVDQIARLAVSIWQVPDLGAWALRTEPRQYVQSRAQVAIAMGMAAADSENANGRYHQTQREIEVWLTQRGHDAHTGGLAMLNGGLGLDASALRLVTRLPLGIPREQLEATVDAIADRLETHGFVRPYTPEQDSFTGPRGASVPASFWLARAFACLGRRTEATHRFERLLGHAGALGLLSEDADPYTARALGNYPSTAAHAALIEAAISIEEP